MGCDIHLYIEILTPNGWELYSHPSVHRNYKMFAKLADVRNSYCIKPISKPKGIPDDVSFIVRKEYEDDKNDYHSESYLNSDEIITLEEWLDYTKPYGDGFLSNDLEYSVLKTYFNGNSFTGIKKYPDDNPVWVKDVRFVFWFDS